MPEVARLVSQRVLHWLTLSPVLASCWPRVGLWTLAGITDINVHLRKLGALAIGPRPPVLADVVARGCHPSLQEGNLRKNTIKESNLHSN